MAKTLTTQFVDQIQARITRGDYPPGSFLPSERDLAEQFDISRVTVRAGLKTLTDEQQNVIVLRFGNGYSLENTAKLMGKNVNAIKALQFRALASLRKKFENLDDE